MCRTPMPPRWSGDPASTDQRNRFVAAWVAEPKFHICKRTLQQAGQQLEAVQRHDRRLGPTGQCHHGGRSERRWQYLQRSAARLYAEMHSLVRIISAPICESRATCAAASASCWNFMAESFNLFNRTNAPGADQRRWLLQFRRAICRLLDHRARESYIPGEFLVNSQFLDAHQCLCTAAGAVLAKAQFLSEDSSTGLDFSATLVCVLSSRQWRKSLLDFAL